MDKYVPIEMVYKPSKYGDTGGTFVCQETEGFEAQVALQLAERWGMVAAVPDGEDSAGRQRLRMMTPDEIADRAVETAKALVTRFRAEGFMVRIPTTSETP